MDVHKEVLNILDEVLRLNGQTAHMHRDSPLLGAIPELDSMAVAIVIATIEERFGFTIADDEIDASNFATLGTLADFVESRATL